MSIPATFALNCLEHSFCGYLVLDAQGCIYWWNQWVTTASGCSWEQVQGQPLVEVFPEAEHPRLQEAMQQALEQGLSSLLSPKLSPVALPFYPPGQQGQQRLTLLIRISAFNQQPQQQRLCLLQFEDISQAWQREQQLRQQARELQQQKSALAASEAHCRTLFSAAPVGLFLTAGNNLQIVSANERLFQLLEKPQTGEPFSLLSFVAADSSQQTLTEYASQADRPRDFIFELDTGGGRRWGLLSLSPTQVNGHDTLIGGLMDITRRIQAEQSAQKARLEAEQANQTKSMFLANMNHEIRTPLNAVLGMAELALEEALPATVRSYLETIDQAGHGLLALINDLLDFSKIEADKLEVHPQETDLEQLLGQLAETFREQARSKGLQLRFTMEGNVPAQVVTDPLRLQQILNNLLSNALKFTHSGAVTLEVSRPLPDTNPDQLCFTVSDTGIGIQLEHLELLFEPFSQGDASTSRTYGGTGLGLAISRRLAAKLGGDIDVSSQPGAGSRFRLLCTAAAAKPLELAAPSWLRDHGVAPWQLTPQQQVQLQRALAPWGLTLTEPPSANAPCAVLVSGVASPPTDRSDKILYLPPAGSPWSRSPALEEPFSPAQLRHKLAVLSGTAAAPSSYDRPLQDYRILVVEDNAVNLEVVQKMLERLGAEVKSCNRGHKALDLLQQGTCAHIDLILLDIQMPEMDGYTTAQKLRAPPISYSGPIIALTAHALASEKKRCLSVGMDDHLPKPVRKEQLRQMLLQYLDIKPANVSDTGPPPTAPLADTASTPLWQPDNGIQRLDGDEQLYRQVLEVFQQEYGHTSPDIEALQQQTPAQARQWAHGLKGAAGNLGAEQLQQAARQLEEDLAAGTATTHHWQQLMELLEQTLAAMQSWLHGESPAPPGPEANPDSPTAEQAQQLINKLQQLQQQLQQQDLRALEAWEQLQPQLAPFVTPSRLQELAAQLESLQLPAAQKRLSNLEQELHQHLPRH